MLKPPQLEPNAPWRQRFRAPSILWTQLAKAAPTRGLVAGTHSGKNQLHAWNISTGELRQLTDHASGVPLGTLAPDGRWVYYLQDTGGNEIGHFVRMPYTGGPVEDLTPTLPPYSAFLLSISHAGNRIGFVSADSTGFHLYCVDLAADDGIGLPHLPATVNQMRHPIRGLLLRSGGNAIANARARVAAWTHMVEFIRENLSR